MSADRVRILVVDDEPADPQAAAHGPRHAGLRGHRGRERQGGAGGSATAEPPDLILLDLGLPDIAGHELRRRRWRAGADAAWWCCRAAPTRPGIVQALELGADDYVAKPFGMNELVARIRVALRRRLQQQGERPVFRTGELSVDLVLPHRQAARGGVKLSPKEYDILRLLVQHMPARS